GAEALLQPVIAVPGGGEHPGARPPEVDRLLGEKLRAGFRAREPQQRLAVFGVAGDDLGGYRPVDQPGRAVLELDPRLVPVRRLVKRAGQPVAHLAEHGADPDRVRSPWFQAQPLLAFAPLQGIADLADTVHRSLSPVSGEAE